MVKCSAIVKLAACNSAQLLTQRDSCRKRGGLKVSLAIEKIDFEGLCSLFEVIILPDYIRGFKEIKSSRCCNLLCWEEF